MENAYPRQKLWESVRCLVGRAELKQRLQNAANPLVEHVPTSLPDLQKQKWNSIVTRLTSVAGPDGSIRATVETLSTDQAAELASEIFDLFIDVRGGI